MSQFIEWSIDGIRFLKADSSGRVSLASTWHTFEHLEDDRAPVELADELKAWMRQHHVTGGPATLLLPREGIVIRRLELPQAPENELPDLVRFQSAAKSSLPIDDLALDFLLLESSPDGQAVLTTSIDKRRLNRFIQLLTQVGFEIHQVTITPLATGQFAREFGGASLGRIEPELIVFQRKSLIELSIFHQGCLVFSHSLVLPDGGSMKGLESSLTRSIVALHQSHPDVEISQCYYLASAAEPSLAELLEKRFSGVHRVELPSALTGGQNTHGFEPLIGAALPVSQASLKLDLLHPRKKIEKPDRRKWYWIGGGTTAAVVLLLAYGIFLSRKSGLEASIESLNATISEIDQKLENGKPDLNAYDRINTWTTGQADPIDAWNALRRYMPGTDRLYISELRLQATSLDDVRARFTGVGFARQRNDVEEFRQNLAENGFRVRPQPTTTATRDPDFPIRFELDVDWLRPQEQADPPVATTEATAGDSAT